MSNNNACYKNNHFAIQNTFTKRRSTINGAALTHAKNLKGDLLFIHGTGDDNVHYQNVEALINELVKNGKSFQIMSYPLINSNRVTAHAQ